MKKIIPFVSPLIFGLFGGLFVSSLISFLSIVVSPFSDPKATFFLVLLGVASLFLALIVIAMTIVTAIYRIRLTDKHKTRIAVVAIFLCSAILFFISWNYSNLIIEELYHILIF